MDTKLYLKLKQEGEVARSKRQLEEQGQKTVKKIKTEVNDVHVPSCSNETSGEVQQNNDCSHLICQLCSQQFKDPRLLDCFHSFCLTCLERPKNLAIIQTSSEGDTLICCPTCYRDTEMPQKGVAGLYRDVKTSKLAKEERVKRQLAAKTSSIICQACDDQHVAVVRCSDCDDFLCHDCKMAHERLSKMKLHSLVSMADLRSGKVAMKSQNAEEVMKCRSHTEQDLCLFCTTCQVAICLMCSALDHCRPEHNYVEITTVAASCRTEIQEVIALVEEGHKELQVAQRSAEQAKNRLDTMVAVTLEKIASKKRAEADRLTRKAKVLKDTVLSVEREKGEKLKISLAEASRHVDEIEHVLQKVKGIMSDDSCYNVLSLKAKILKNLKLASVKKAENVPLDLSFIDFRESSDSSGNLGDLLLGEKWALKEEFGQQSYPVCDFQWAKSIAVCSNGDMVVVDSGTSKVVIYTSKGVKKGTISSNIPSGILETPIDIATSSSNKLFVLDGVVKLYNTDRKFLFTLDIPANSMPKCMDVDGGKVAVGMRNMKMILLLNEDGSSRTLVPAEKIDKHITICSTKQSLVYTNYDSSRLISVGFNGLENFNIETVVNNKSVKPTGVCTDKKGDIYVAVHTGVERGTGEIHHYSPEGNYFGCVANNLYNPFGLTFTPRGELTVADRHSVKLFHRV